MDRAERQKTFRIAAVSYLNTVPLIEGLADDPAVRLVRAVPSELLAQAAGGRADAVLLPSIDLQRADPPLTVLPAGCISSTGETLTVRIFSAVEPADLSVLAVDSDSHTSVALAQVLWAGRFGRRLELLEHRAGGELPPRAQAVLLIGDKVVTSPARHLTHQVDLGSLWYELTGLPFVFAVWAGRPDADLAGLYLVLRRARLYCRDRLGELARREAAAYGWPADLAERYLTRNLGFDFTPDHRRGMEEFHRRAEACGIIPRVRPLAYYDM